MTGGAVLLALVTGFGSALVPIVNAEAFAALTSVGTGAAALVLAVLALAVGQTAGKVVLFESGRRGSVRTPARWWRILARSAVGRPRR